jgi:hypothetical protein
MCSSKIKRLFLFVGLLLFAFLVLFYGYHSYKRGYADGAQFTNGWWIDQKSIYFETKKIIRKRIAKGYDRI